MAKDALAVAHLLVSKDTAETFGSTELQPRPHPSRRRHCPRNLGSVLSVPGSVTFRRADYRCVVGQRLEQAGMRWGEYGTDNVCQPAFTCSCPLI